MTKFSPTKLSIYGLCCALILTMGCTPSQTIKRDDDQVIGRPPTDDDPFTDTRLPEEAKATSTSGIMDVQPDKKGSSAKPRTADPVPDTKLAPVASTTPSKQRVPGHQCYACVRVCAATDTSSDCSNSAEDMICGWGHGPSKNDAMTLATTQCDAALNMIRASNQWRRVDGRCPVASCRE